MKAISESVRDLQRSGIRAVMDVAFRHPGVLRLEVGDPDFPTPSHIIEAAEAAARDGFTHYTASRGLAGVREAMAAKLESFNHIDAGPEDIVITSGAGHGLFSVCRALTDPGDVVLIPDPGWPNYRTIAAVCGVTAIGYPLIPEEGFAPDLDRLGQLLSEVQGIKFVVVNSPSNPTGAVWSSSTLAKIVDLCTSHDVYMVSDECYEAITFEDRHVSPATMDDSDRIVSVFSLSKTYAMTGWRVGYVVGTPDIVDAVGKIVETSVSCASAISQKAAESAITGDQSIVEEMVSRYRQRRDMALDQLHDLGMAASTPRGAFYLLVEVPAEDTLEFTMRLVEEERVTVAPGEAFGPGGSGRVRLSLASHQDIIREGIERLARFSHSQAGGANHRR